VAIVGRVFSGGSKEVLDGDIAKGVWMERQ
jgi:hypothetical protein